MKNMPAPISNPGSNQPNSANPNPNNPPAIPPPPVNFEQAKKEQEQKFIENNKKRFQIELEFVQCLANPNYVNFLAQRGYFQSKKFLNYIEYLNYWRLPMYCRHLRYPQCLAMLELLKFESFRDSICNQNCARFIEDQLILQWQYYNKKQHRASMENIENMAEMNKEADGVAGDVKNKSSSTSANTAAQTWKIFLTKFARFLQKKASRLRF